MHELQECESCTAATEGMINGRFGVGFSDATGAAFELRVALPGVGEALKREIAGLVWVDR